MLMQHHLLALVPAVQHGAASSATAAFSRVHSLFLVREAPFRDLTKTCGICNIMALRRELTREIISFLRHPPPDDDELLLDRPFGTLVDPRWSMLGEFWEGGVPGIL